jgi:molybdate transport system ATP-binding protein
MTGLDATIVATHADFELSVRLTAAPGRITAVLGPNGAGKSTLLAALAGLRGLEAGIFVPPEQRRIGFVFQDFLLFPHLSVLDNVAFGPRSRREPDARSRAQDWLSRLGIADLAHRRPASLSGGQAQRVAMARALATDPDLLLLDEPLAALDASTRLEVRRELRTHLSTFPGVTLLVTHDPLDALVLADDMVVLEGGRVTQAGTVDDVAARPATPYVATLMGANLLHGTADAGQVRAPDGTAIAIADTSLTGEVVVVLRPEAISLHRAHPEGSARNVWPVVVRDLEPRLDRILVHVDGPPGLVIAITPAAVADLGVMPGARMWASAKALDLDAYARAT